MLRHTSARAAIATDYMYMHGLSTVAVQRADHCITSATIATDYVY